MARGNYPSQTADRFQIRFTDGLHERIKRAAAENNRSMNSELNFRLEASFAAAAKLYPGVAALLDKHIEAEVSARLAKIAQAIEGRTDA